jgi:hypothetical protein
MKNGVSECIPHTGQAHKPDGFHYEVPAHCPASDTFEASPKHPVQSQPTFWTSVDMPAGRSVLQAVECPPVFPVEVVDECETSLCVS